MLKWNTKYAGLVPTLLLYLFVRTTFSQSCTFTRKISSYMHLIFSVVLVRGLDGERVTGLKYFCKMF